MVVVTVFLKLICTSFNCQLISVLYNLLPSALPYCMNTVQNGMFSECFHVYCTVYVQCTVQYACFKILLSFTKIKCRAQIFIKKYDGKNWKKIIILTEYWTLDRRSSPVKPNARTIRICILRHLHLQTIWLIYLKFCFTLKVICFELSFRKLYKSTAQCTVRRFNWWRYCLLLSSMWLNCRPFPSIWRNFTSHKAL